MLEIPESYAIAAQINRYLKGKTITEVVNSTSPHKFAFYYGEARYYPSLLIGRTIENAVGHGMYVDIHLDEKICISISDGTNIRYYSPSDKIPEKHQLLIGFDDNSFLVFTVAMYGSICAFEGTMENKYYQGSLHSISPLDEAFDQPYFEELFHGLTKNMSVKAFLATEQRIPGLGNGVLQDILFHAGIHPKRKTATLSESDLIHLYHSIKSTLEVMADQGGRDTERDLFGNPGGYKTILSRNTVDLPCPRCGDVITKEAFLGGAVYYCPTCQK